MKFIEAHKIHNPRFMATYRNNIAPPEVPWTFNQVLVTQMAEADFYENATYRVHSVRNIDPRPDRFAIFSHEKCIASGLTKHQSNQIIEHLQDMEDRLARLPRFDTTPQGNVYQNHFGYYVRARDIRILFGSFQ